MRDLGLSKVNSKLLASKLKEKNVFTPATNIMFFCTREQDLLVYFDENKTSNSNFVYCQDIHRLLERVGVEEHLPDAWRLFVDSNKRSLKCILLYNENENFSVPIGNSIHVKEM